MVRHYIELRQKMLRIYNGQNLLFYVMSHNTAFLCFCVFFQDKRIIINKTISNMQIGYIINKCSKLPTLACHELYVFLPRIHPYSIHYTGLESRLIIIATCLEFSFTQFDFFSNVTSRMLCIERSGGNISFFRNTSNM